MTNATSKILPLIACDDGYAATKVAWWNDKGKISTLSIPSRATTGLITSDMNGKSVDSYEADGVAYTVLERSRGSFMDTRFPEYPLSALNRVIVSHALIKAGFGGQFVRLSSSLPPGKLFNSRGSNAELMAAKRENLMKPVVSLSNKQAPIIEASHVFPEGASAIVDLMLSDDGNLVDFGNGDVVVVDIGGRTTDIVTVQQPGSLIDRSRTTSKDLGVLNILDTMARDIGEQHHVDDTSRLDMERALREGVITLFDSDVDVQAIRHDAIREVGEKILRVVQSYVGNGASVSKVLFIGGGASVLGDVVKSYRNAVVHPDPEFANARGMLKGMTFLYPDE